MSELFRSIVDVDPDGLHQEKSAFSKSTDDCKSIDRKRDKLIAEVCS